MATLRVLPGPHGREVPGELEALLSGSYVVDPRSDRMGLRLRRRESAREPPLRGGQVLSEGVPRGAVQVPPGGDPIVLLADAQTTGGYAMPAVVVAADHWRAAQLRPGDAARFVLVTEEEALRALRTRQAELAGAAGKVGRERGSAGVPDTTALMRGFTEWSEAADLGTPREDDDDDPR
jgi:allophanate hydrolase subunit 2